MEAIKISNIIGPHKTGNRGSNSASSSSSQFDRQEVSRFYDQRSDYPRFGFGIGHPRPTPIIVGRRSSDIGRTSDVSTG